MAKYEVGSCVVYDTYGVCKIEDIKAMSFLASMPKQDYYVLSVMGAANSTYYVPVKGEAEKKLRKPMNNEQIKQLLSEALAEEVNWIDNRQERKDAFLRILDAGITPTLIALIGCIYERKISLSENGKSLSGTDEGILASADKLIKEEFAFSLGIGSDEVTDYIRNFFTCIKK